MSPELNKMKMDDYFRQLGKLYRKMHGKDLPAEIILIGGASCIINYGFREITSDIDAIILASSAFKEAIKQVARDNGLNDGWLNDDFKYTESFSYQLRQYSTHYKTFSNCLDVRTIKGEYLIAMKLMSNRYYKNDISDIAGILRDQIEIGDPINFERVDTAMNNLYNGWNNVDDSMKSSLLEMLELSYDSLDHLYDRFASMEKDNKERIKALDEIYTLNHDFDPNTYLQNHDGAVDWQSSIDDIKNDLDKGGSL